MNALCKEMRMRDAEQPLMLSEKLGFRRVGSVEAWSKHHGCGQERRAIFQNNNQCVRELRESVTESAEANEEQYELGLIKF
jgi:hypothetical protein